MYIATLLKLGFEEKKRGIHDARDARDARDWHQSPAQPHLIPAVALSQHGLVRHRRCPQPSLGIRQGGPSRRQRVPMSGKRVV